MTKYCEENGMSIGLASRTNCNIEISGCYENNENMNIFVRSAIRQILQKRLFAKKKIKTIISITVYICLITMISIGSSDFSSSFTPSLNNLTAVKTCFLIEILIYILLMSDKI
jgi:hypothetical protein